MDRVFPVSGWANFRVLVAVSGGADSVALLRALVANCQDGQDGSSARQNLTVVHVDHGTRGQASSDDAAFVQQLAAKLGVDFRLLLLESNVAADAGSGSASEERLRDRRYDAIVRLAGEIGARYLLTGHHLNDQVETVLFRVFRGTGVSGLQGIPFQRTINSSLTLVRPLLSVSRQAIQDYLVGLKQGFREDESNADRSFTRNFLRNEILPALEKEFGDVAAAVERLRQHAGQLDRFLAAQANTLLETSAELSTDRVSLDLTRLCETDEVVIQKLLNLIWQRQSWPLQDMTAVWWNRLVQAITSVDPNNRSIKLNLPGGLSFERDNRQVVIHQR